ncbi:hypothetical protein GOP47_0024732 [Adiantum capillus-veneris]|uniref:AIPP2-like SPOC-like domain-containing protein n=1 Tax=Adiantum capillus-veneris TaxID=13818 RepID=A0A9D4U374_ADICA|nr:hypothetical protein GOP47_0024732 [Adiantum capillus-veneris]
MQVTLCDICGVEGFSEFIAVCSQCNERAEHIYCMQAFCDALPPSWVCEGCKLAQLQSCEGQNGTLVITIDCNRTAQSLHEAKPQNEQCTSEQEQGEIEESICSEGELNKDSSLPAGSAPQVGTPSDINADNEQYRSNVCKSIPPQKQVDSNNSHHGTQGAPSRKLRAPSASQFKESEQMPSFLLPSRPKTLPRSKSISSLLPHVGANKKAEQLKGNPKHTEETVGSNLRKATSSSILGSRLDSENQPMQGFECFARRHHPHAGILEQPVAHALLGKQPNLSSGASMHYGQLPIPDYPRPVTVSSERHPPQFLDPYQGRPLQQHEFAVQNILSQMSNNCHAQNVSTVDNILPHISAIPHVQKLWRGSFNVDLGGNSSKIYKGIQGHPSSKADQKVWEAARTLPRLLKVKELRRGLDYSTWPEHFSLNPPNSQNVGLFFFPVDMERHDSWYKPLLDRMISYDLMLRAESANLYLLIFHSQLFPNTEQLWDGRFYLWGIFRPKKSPLMQRAMVLQPVQDASDNTEVVDMDIDSNDVLPLTKMSEELPLPPLPPGSPPAVPPLPLSQQSQEGGGSAAAKRQTVLQEVACMISYHVSDGEQKHAVPDSVEQTMAIHNKSVMEDRESGLVDIHLNAAGPNVERTYVGHDLKAESQTLNTSPGDSLRNKVDSGSQGPQVGDGSSCSVIFQKPVQDAALKSGKGTSMSEPQHSACVLEVQPMQLPVLISLETSAMSASKAKSKRGLTHSPSRHDSLGGSSCRTSLQLTNKKASNGLERGSEEAELSEASENCVAGHALSKGKDTTAGIQDEVIFSSARADSTSLLLRDDIGKDEISEEATLKNGRNEPYVITKATRFVRSEFFKADFIVSIRRRLKMGSIRTNFKNSFSLILSCHVYPFDYPS